MLIKGRFYFLRFLRFLLVKIILFLRFTSKKNSSKNETPTQLHTKAWKFLEDSVFSKNEKSEAFFRRKTNEKRKKYISI